MSPLTLVERIVQIRAGGRVERCHGVPHSTSYSNAAHSWGVAMLMHAIWPGDFPRLALHCLAHDVPEAWVGDIPAPTKRYANIKAQVEELEDRVQLQLGLPLESELTTLDRMKLKNCDSLELWLWAVEQVVAGNAFARDVKIELDRYFVETPLLQDAQVFYDELCEDLGQVVPRHESVIMELCSGSE